MYTYLSVTDRRVQELLEVLVSFLFLVPSFAPLRDSLSVEDEDVEERIEQENDIRLDRHTIKQHRLWGLVERVRHQRRLHHDQRVVHVFFVQDMPTRSSLALRHLKLTRNTYL